MATGHDWKADEGSTFQSLTGKDRMQTLEVKVKVAVLLGFILLATMPATLGVSLGVKSGDWIVYDLQGSFSSERGQRIEFESVAGTNLTVVVTDTLAGTQTSQPPGYIDLATNEDFATSFFRARVYIIPVDISVGNSVYLGNEFGNRTISGETTGTYAGADRRVLYANFSVQESQYTMYWDKQTGVLVEATKQTGVLSETLSTVGTNMWTGGLGWWLWVLIAIAVACGIITSKKDTIRKLARTFHARRADEKRQNNL
jgi:hypothetical protein